MVALLSYGFVHGNLVHVGFNLWVLFDIGRMVEARRGPGYLAAAFVAGTAMGAYLTSVAQAGETLVLVGASGGVLGVAGALLADVAGGRGQSIARCSVSCSSGCADRLLSVAIPNVSLWGHVGGALGGLLWGFARQGLPADRRIDVARRRRGGVGRSSWRSAQVGRLVASLLLGGARAQGTTGTPQTCVVVNRASRHSDAGAVASGSSPGRLLARRRREAARRRRRGVRHRWAASRRCRSAARPRPATYGVAIDVPALQVYVSVATPSA